MSDVPFGFSAGPGPDDDDNDSTPPVPNQGSGGATGAGGGSGSSDVPGGGQPDEQDPMAALFGMLGSGADLGQMFAQLGQMFSWSGGPVNWDLANQSARQVVAAAGDRSVGASERRDVDDAFRLAETWLNEVTSFPATGGAPRTWSRAEWVEGTQQAWREFIDPVAARVSDAMGSALPAEMAQAAGPLVGMMRQMGVSMWGAQVGQSIGTLAGEVFGASDIGLPMAAGHPALLPANVREFGKDLSIELRDVTLYLALREAAYLRLYSHAPWLRSHIIALIERYAGGISVDTGAIESAVRDIDPANPEALQDALQGGLFELSSTPDQESTLKRLELILALVEGWVDDVVTQAADGRMPSAAALRETVRRRRASGGPAEQTFATLVGLQVRPRKLREAADFWAAVRHERGVDGRDAIWAHPDLLPQADDLTDPAAYLAADSLDLDLSHLEAEFGGLDDTGHSGHDDSDSDAAAPESTEDTEDTSDPDDDRGA